MKFKALFFLLFLTALSCNESAKSQHKILIILDCSNGMSQMWTGQISKMQAAQFCIATLLDSFYQIDSSIQLGLRSTGGNPAIDSNSCFDSKYEVFFSADDRVQMKFRSINLTPRGRSSLYFSFKEAIKKEIAPSHKDKYYVIFISNGHSSCDPEACEMISLISKDISGYYFVNLDTSKKIKCNDHFFNPGSKSQIYTTVTSIINDFKQAEGKVNTDQTVHKNYGYLRIENYMEKSYGAALCEKVDSGYRILKDIKIDNLNSKSKMKLLAGNYKLMYLDRKNIDLINRSRGDGGMILISSISINDTPEFYSEGPEFTVYPDSTTVIKLGR
jgi:hypothetical protein